MPHSRNSSVWAASLFCWQAAGIVRQMLLRRVNSSLNEFGHCVFARI